MACDFTAGWISGSIGVLVGHPFDTVKVVQQTRGYGPLLCIKRIYDLYGVKGFFRGLGFPLLASGAYNSLFFGVYGLVLPQILEFQQYEWQLAEHSRAGIHISHEDMPPNWAYLSCFFAGNIGGFTALSITCPVEVVKIKMISEGNRARTSPHQETRTRHGLLQCVKLIYAAKGFKGFYQGLPIMACREIPSYGTYMTVYEFLSHKVRSWRKNDREIPHFLGLFAAGGFAGTASWWAVLVVDVLKSKIQADDPKKPKYRGILDCARQTVARYGVKGLFSGFWAITCRSFPVNGAKFLMFELVHRLCTGKKRVVIE